MESSLTFSPVAAEHRLELKGARRSKLRISQNRREVSGADDIPAGRRTDGVCVVGELIKKEMIIYA